MFVSPKVTVKLQDSFEVVVDFFFSGHCGMTDKQTIGFRVSFPDLRELKFEDISHQQMSVT